MAGNPDAGERSATVQQALSVVDLGKRASTAYGRSDLAERLALTRKRLSDPAFHVFVVGEFKQGKSSLVNALLNAPVCPVDDDIATAVPTAIGFGDPPIATVLLDPGGDDADPEREPIRRDIAVEQVARHVTEASDPTGEHRVTSVEVKLPRKLLSDGLVIVDTPGVGGLGSAHSAATIGALPMADAVVFVSDSSQEFTAPELEFLDTARKMCPNVVCVLTKTDFYPAWRKIRDLDVEHLERAGMPFEIMCVSSSLRIHALRTNDRDLNRESGFPALAGYLQNQIAANAEKLSVRAAASDVVAVSALLETQFRNERQALTDPEQARAQVANLTDLKARAERLRSGVSKWQQTLNDGIADLQADVDHDLRSRLRVLVRQADEALDTSDPADSWDDFQAWLYRRVAADVVGNYAFLVGRGQQLAARVAEHFGEDGATLVVDLDVANPTDVLTTIDADTQIDVHKMGVGVQSLSALRGSYGGVLMFSMLGRMAGLGALAVANPATIILGLFMGRQALRGEKERQLTVRRNQARQALRKYTDEVSFVVGKDARDTLRQVQRRLRDFFAARAEELHRSTSEALAAAQQAAKSDETTRQKRRRDVDAELKRITVLRDKAYALAPDLRSKGRAGAAKSAARSGS
jgi:GTPase Era involved in 16S rRNA processing